MKKTALFLILMFLGQSCLFAQDIASRFKDNQKINYDVYYNFGYCGYVQWKYLGKKKIGPNIADVLSVDSETNIFNIFDLVSDEKVFLDSKTHLPLKVERDIILSGKKELIEETYDQNTGRVTIKRKSGRTTEKVYQRTPPVSNILALLYFFPANIELENDKWMEFTLPNQKIRIKYIEERTLKTEDAEEETYFLLGRGAKRFSLWLDKKTRLPLRIEFILPIGKVSIVKVKQLRKDTNKEK